MDLKSELVAHPVFGTGRVISHDGKRISIQFSEETGEKCFVYPDAFEKYLKMDNPVAAQKVLTDLTAKIEQSEELQRKEEEFKQKAFERLALAAQKIKIVEKTKPAKAKAKTKTKTKSKA
ncbi:MAG: hypothetical protein PHX14_06955 [Syntrophomonadaceae bacterium]|nr:hypothetical protein [Syntrophomonadaceae bacterium]